MEIAGDSSDSAVKVGRVIGSSVASLLTFFVPQCIALLTFLGFMFEMFEQNRYMMTERHLSFLLDPIGVNVTQSQKVTVNISA